MTDEDGGLRKLHAQSSSLISPTFSLAISRMLVLDIDFLVWRGIKCRNCGVRVVSREVRENNRVE